MAEALYPNESYKIVGSLFDVFNELGYGYQEKYYYRAIKNRLLAHNFNVEEQLYMPLVSDDKKIGGYYLDFKINSQIILEIKVANAVYPPHIKQVLGYLKAHKLQLGIIGVFTKNGIIQKRVVNLY
jgi:GxxExxY protein